MSPAEFQTEAIGKWFAKYSSSLDFVSAMTTGLVPRLIEPGYDMREVSRAAHSNNCTFVNGMSIFALQCFGDL